MARQQQRQGRRQAQTQYGPESQEIGGFWPAAACALTKGVMPLAGRMPGRAIAWRSWPGGLSATVWQAWQAEQFSQPGPVDAPWLSRALLS